MSHIILNLSLRKWIIFLTCQIDCVYPIGNRTRVPNTVFLNLYWLTAHLKYLESFAVHLNKIKKKIVKVVRYQKKKKIEVIRNTI